MEKYEKLILEWDLSEAWPVIPGGNIGTGTAIGAAAGGVLGAASAARKYFTQKKQIQDNMAMCRDAACKERFKQQLQNLKSSAIASGLGRTVAGAGIGAGVGAAAGAGVKPAQQYVQGTNNAAALQNMSPRHQAAAAKIGIAPPTAVAKAAQPATSTISNIQNRIGAGGQANTAGTQEFLQRGRIASAAQTRQQLNAINAANKRRGWLDRWWSGGGQGS